MTSHRAILPVSSTARAIFICLCRGQFNNILCLLDSQAKSLELQKVAVGVQLEYLLQVTSKY